MPQIVITGRSSQRIAAGATRIQIASSQLANGVAVVGDTFIPGSLADFYITADLWVDAISQVRAYTIELFNETLSSVVQSFTVSADATGIGDCQSFIFGFSVTDILHAYSLRVSATGGGDDARLNIVGSRWLVSTFGSESAIKAWVAFDYIGSTVNIRSSSNIASITHTATGRYRVTFNSGFSDLSYGMMGDGRMDGRAGRVTPDVDHEPCRESGTVCNIYTLDNAGTPTDPALAPYDLVNVIFFGD